MQRLDSGLIVPNGGILEALDQDIAAQKRAAEERAKAPLGLCYDCPRIATIECPDQAARCTDCAKALARSILKAASRNRHCSTPAAKKARAKRRSKRKATKR